MAIVFSPTRNEPFFESLDSIPGVDLSKLRLTVRWADYLDNIGAGVNSSSGGVEDEVSALESEIKKVAAIQHELRKDINDLFELIDERNNNAQIAQLIKRIDDLEQIIDGS